MQNDRPSTPLWFKILVIVMMLPAAGFPLLVSALSSDADDTVKLLVWFYPAYMIASGVCARMCYVDRREVSWVLIALMLASTAGTYWLAVR